MDNFVESHTPGEMIHSFIVGCDGAENEQRVMDKLRFMMGLQDIDPTDNTRQTRCVVLSSTKVQCEHAFARYIESFGDSAMEHRHHSRRLTIEIGGSECELVFHSQDNMLPFLSVEATFGIIDDICEIYQTTLSSLEGRCGRYPHRGSGGATNFGIWGSIDTSKHPSAWVDILNGDSHGRSIKYFSGNGTGRSISGQ